MGQIGYYTGLKVLDYWGVTDPYIAHLNVPLSGRGLPGHEKGNRAYLIAQRPTYVVFGFDQRRPPLGYSYREFIVEGRRWGLLLRDDYDSETPR